MNYIRMYRYFAWPHYPNSLEKNGTQSAHSYIRQTGIDYCCWHNRSIILWCWHVLWHGVGKYDCRNHHWYCRYTIASFSYSSDKRYQRVNIQQKLTGQLTKTTVGKRVISEQRYRMVLSAAVSLSFHFLYALYHGVLGVVHSSLWFITMCAYYAILSVMRFSVVLFEYKNKSKSSADTEYFVMRLSGILLILLSFVLSGVIYISISQNIAVKYDEILMITIAAYTFFKIIMAIVKAVKQHKNPSPLLAVIRNIGYAEAAASILTLQRSMLVSFGTMDNTEAHIMNILTGAAVCLYVLIIGMYLLLKRKNRTKTAI